jgi:hypothetical protein
MLSNNLGNDPKEPQASLLRDVKAGATEVPLMRPQDPVEGTTTGNGTTTDPPGTDRPPGYGDLELMA